MQQWFQRSGTSGLHHDVKAALGALCIDLGYSIAPSDLVVHLPLVGRPTIIAPLAGCGFKFDGHLEIVNTRTLTTACIIFHKYMTLYKAWQAILALLPENV